MAKCEVRNVDPAEISLQRNNAIADALLVCAVDLRSYYNTMQSRAMENQDRIVFLERENKKLRESLNFTIKYYEAMLVGIGEAIGEEARTRDDGSLSPDVVLGKVAKLAIKRITDAATAKLEAFEQMARYWESRGCKTEAREARRMAREMGL